MSFGRLLQKLSLFVLTLMITVAFSSFSYAEGMIEDKDNLEKRGPGNLDVPLEKDPTKPQAKPTEPKPEPKPEAKEEVTPKAEPKPEKKAY